MIAKIAEGIPQNARNRFTGSTHYGLGADRRPAHAPPGRHLRRHQRAPTDQPAMFSHDRREPAGAKVVAQTT